MQRAPVIKGALAMSALLAVMPAQAQTDVVQPATTQSTVSGAGASSATLSMADQKILTSLAMENMAELDAARMVQGKSDNDDIKKFAQQMIDDHGKALDDVTQLAQTKGVTLPAELDASHKAKSDKLAKLTGSAFERAYLARAGVADHQQDHGMLKKAQSQAKDADLKALLARTMPVVDQHLAAAQQLNRDTARGSSKTQGQTGVSPDKK